MDPDIQEVEVFSDTEGPFSPTAENKENEEEEDVDEDEEEDARIFNAWMQHYRRREKQRKSGDEEEENGESEGGRSRSRSSLEPPNQMRVDRRASLPCPSTLSAMLLSRLHSSTQAPVTARVLLHSSSSRSRLLSPMEAISPSPKRRQSLIHTIPEAVPPERRGHFRRRNVMSLSDAYSMCLICHNNLNQGSGGTRELQCSHTFHRECIEEWLWRKQSCPTCHIQVSVPQSSYWTSTRVKVP
ncbi:uncharacterized protein KZ484_020057 [Pholidichthys leucotaenia]